MKKLLLSITIALLLFGVPAVAQQDAQYSQYIFNGIYINPAYAGYKENLNLHMFYRNQWTGIDGAPKSMSLAVDAIANSGNVGLAFQVSSDKLGAQNNLAAYGNYAYRIRLNDEGTSRLALGVGLGALQLGIDGSMFNPNDPERDAPTGNQTAIVPDARAGAFFSNEHFFAGFSVDNLISQYIELDKYAFIPQPKAHFYLTAGAMVKLGDGLKLKPSFLIKDDRKGPTSLDLNAFFLFGDRLWLGGSYRTGVKLYEKNHLQNNLSNLNSAIAAVEFYATDKLRIGYAHDFSVGPLRGYSSGTHEISVGFTFLKPTVRMATPRFF